jgi:hypothetical protein
MEILREIFVLQLCFLLTLSITRIFITQISIHLLNFVNLLILFFIILIMQNPNDFKLFLKLYLSNSIIFIILLSTLERSVALGLLRKIYLNRRLKLIDLEKSFDIKILVKMRIKNLQKNNLLRIYKSKVKLTKTGFILFNFIYFSIKIFK